MRSRGCIWVCAAALVLACGLAAAQVAPPGSKLKPSDVALLPDGTLRVQYTLEVTLFWGAPSCFARPIILTSGIFEPEIVINQRDVLAIRLVNKLPKDYPTVSDGISIHYHGLHQRGPAAWFDGTSYVNLCPVAPGTTYEYEFRVEDPPGTYLWHDHAAGFKGDGLQGPLLVLPPRAPPAVGKQPAFGDAHVPDLWSYDGEHVVFISDWFHSSTSSMFFRLNQPFDSARVTNESGSWNWIGNPQAILINGQGFYGDCQLFAPAGASTAPPTCAPSVFTVAPGRSVQQPWASNNNPGCTHSSFVVEAGKTYRLRLVNAGALVYMTVCFEGHSVQVVALDGIPIEPITTQCVDINSGQRADVLLTADQPAANYWITVASQFRVGAPAGYGVLSYAGAPNTTAATLPTTPAPQPVNITANLNLKVTMSSELASNNANRSAAAALYIPYDKRNLAPPARSTKALSLNFSQPLMPANGQLRWALNNVVGQKTPPCKPFMQLITRDPAYIRRNAVDPRLTNASLYATVGISEGTGNGRNNTLIYQEGLTPVPVYPSVGLHIVTIEGGAVVDVVVNNGPANSFNGDYRPVDGPTRVAMEQHPFHMHGHRFWILGTGTDGKYDPALHAASLNTRNPVYRDTVTVAAGGWAYVRFVADNPGVWPFHCHILSHVFMGQQVYLVEDAANIAPQPVRQPKCPSRCRYNFAPYTKSFIRTKYGTTGFELPPFY